MLQTWLRLNALWQNTSAVASIGIEQPVFVVGPPRTGTTILLELLALDRQLRAPIVYEALYPLSSTGSVARRMQLAESEQELWAISIPRSGPCTNWRATCPANACTS